jgi:hypothetical protein
VDAASVGNTSEASIEIARTPATTASITKVGTLK